VNAPNRQKARLQFVLIAVVFLGPLAVAAWLYFSGSDLVPAARSNHGALLEPLVNLDSELPDSAVLNLHDNHWLLLYANDETCDEACQDSLYTQRQSRLMLGKEMDRLIRVFLHGDTAPDTVFLAKEHPGMVAIEDAGLRSFLQNKRPADLPDGGFYLIDPLGNLVMYFRPDLDPSDMVSDIKRLLRLSRIG
jgi:cytochrome oxidase Cu insertion factor (SCO1/SenC/PrrC family)